MMNPPPPILPFRAPPHIILEKSRGTQTWRAGPGKHVTNAVYPAGTRFDPSGIAFSDDSRREYNNADRRAFREWFHYDPKDLGTIIWPKHIRRTEKCVKKRRNSEKKDTSTSQAYTPQIGDEYHNNSQIPIPPAHEPNPYEIIRTAQIVVKNKFIKETGVLKDVAAKPHTRWVGDNIDDSAIVTLSSRSSSQSLQDFPADDMPSSQSSQTTVQSGLSSSQSSFVVSSQESRFTSTEEPGSTFKAFEHYDPGLREAKKLARKTSKRKRKKPTVDESPRQKPFCSSCNQEFEHPDYTISLSTAMTEIEEKTIERDSRALKIVAVSEELCDSEKQLLIKKIEDAAAELSGLKHIWVKATYLVLGFVNKRTRALAKFVLLELLKDMVPSVCVADLYRFKRFEEKSSQDYLCEIEYQKEMSSHTQTVVLQSTLPTGLRYSTSDVESRRPNKEPVVGDRFYLEAQHMDIDSQSGGIAMMQGRNVIGFVENETMPEIEAILGEWGKYGWHILDAKRVYIEGEVTSREVDLLFPTGSSFNGEFKIVSATLPKQNVDIAELYIAEKNL